MSADQCSICHFAKNRGVLVEFEEQTQSASTEGECVSFELARLVPWGEEYL